jgi:hypothetical protein
MAVAVAGIFSGVAHAVPLTLTGNKVQVGISDFGTFGSNGATAPGILHDPTGTGNFAPGGIPNDYLTPGTPHDGFSLKSSAFGFSENDNFGVADFATISGPSLLVGPDAMGFANAATWLGGNSFVTVRNSYFFNPGDERILINTVITSIATFDITNLKFARSTDPDPDVNLFGNFNTVNQRGNSLFAPEDFVGSAGEDSGLFLGLLNNSGNTYPHNTRVDAACCSNIDPDVVLGGGAASGTADDGLNIAWDLGTLEVGQSKTVSYFYVFGDDIDTGGGDPGTRVPVPGVLSLLGIGFAAAALLRRRKSK